jgi:hypothetical protein
MNYLGKTGLLLSILVLVGGGCINITINGVETEIPLQDIADETIQFVDEVSDTSVYGNVHGYSFSYMKYLHLWSGLDHDNQELIDATEDDLRVVLSSRSPLLFQGEMNTLSFEVIESTEDPIIWARANMEEFDFIEAEGNFFGDNYSFVETRVQGVPALDIYGGANLGSKYRTLIIDLGEELLVIEQGADEPLFDDVFGSLTIE